MAVEYDGVLYFDLPSVASILDLDYNTVAKLTQGDEPKLATISRTPEDGARRIKKYVSIETLENYITERYLS